MLEGELSFREGTTEDAVKALEEAIALEDALVYMEPPDWIQPVRHTLGAVLLREGRVKEAEAVYREAISLLTPLAARSDDPEVSWSLARSHDYLGLVLRATGRHREAEDAHRSALAAGSRLTGGARYRVSIADFHDHLGIVLAETGRRRRTSSRFFRSSAARTACRW